VVADLFFVGTEQGGAAGRDVAQGLTLFRGQSMAAVVGLALGLEDLRDLEGGLGPGSLGTG